MTTHAEFDKYSYLPFNNLVSVIQDAGGYDRGRLAVAKRRIVAQYRAHAAKRGMADDAVALFSWFDRALDQLIAQVVEAHANGELPNPERLKSGRADVDALEALYRRVCDFVITGMNGWRVPRVEMRETPHPGSGGCILDIVPAEPGYGGEDARPDWYDGRTLIEPEGT